MISMDNTGRYSVGKKFLKTSVLLISQKKYFFYNKDIGSPLNTA